jgi:hypothetical protein
MSNLNTKAMLVDLSISQYHARKFDKKISKAVTDQYGAVEKAARTNKNLFPFEAPSYEAIDTLVGEARRFHNYETLVWNDKGERILLAKNHPKYSGEMRAYKAKFETLVPIFIDDYPTLKEWSKAKLNGMYKEEDFPTIEKLKKKFSFTTSVSPIPDADDFRVLLQADEVLDIREQISKETNDRIAQAMREPYQRLYEVVSKMAEKLNDPDAVFHKTLVSNVRDLCDHTLTALNLTDDPYLEEIGAKISAGLCQFEPDLLRDNKLVRETVGRRSEEIMKDLAAAMGGMA